MAASSRTSGIAGIGKRVVSQIWSPNCPLPLPPLFPSVWRTLFIISPQKSVKMFRLLRRAAHTSVYDKNPEDQATATVVPDEVIKAPSDKYWAPHPKTGVFGPETDLHLRAHGELPKPGNAENSVLEHTAWFRPTSLEDLEKPSHH
ncbi:late embryogenesis abundant protein At5g17165-like [Eucalyptus grandis]|uniref:late embryogenesis abundant protein At5g17165-like n=1 Tax=Eucalyptus grandis TaxID=71139 RepID=UPI00192EA124|nr:late embryogenesis abundant protein At5g17165-like [Eucalyptus grandis]